MFPDELLQWVYKDFQWSHELRTDTQERTQLRPSEILTQAVWTIGKQRLSARGVTPEHKLS